MPIDFKLEVYNFWRKLEGSFQIETQNGNSRRLLREKERNFRDLGSDVKR